MFTKIFYLKIITALIFCFSYTTTFSQNKAKEKEIALALETVDTINNSFEKITKLTSTAGKNRYTKPTRKLIEKAIKISKTENENILLAHAYYSMGNYFYYQSKTDSSLFYLDKARNHAQKSNDPLIIPSILATKAGVYSKTGKVIQAISIQIEAKQILDKTDSLLLNKEQKHKLKGQKLTLNNSLANLYNKTEDYKNALFYYDKAYQSAIDLGSEANASIILGNKGDLLIKMNKIEDALTTLKKSKELKIKANLPERFIGISYLNIGTAYKKINKFDKALENFDKALSIFNNNNVSDGIMRVTTIRGQLYNQINKPILALADCTKGKLIAKQNNDPEFTYKACNCLFIANKKLGNFKEALLNHEVYSRVKDSLFNKKNVRKITQIGMQYEFDKIETKQKLQIEKEKQKKNLILIGLIASGIMLVGLFVFFRKRIKYQKTISKQTQTLQQQKIIELNQQNKLVALNSMIEGQEAERFRIANDLHDSLGGLLSTVKTHFNVIKSENKQIEQLPITKKTNNLIDEACIEVRRISHNMMPHALSISGLKGAIEDLGERMNKADFQTTVEINKLPNTISETKKAMIYRLIQEIISNIKKHAEAKTILIQLIGHQDGLNILIEDDGKGFNYEEAIKKSGLGLKSINSRVEFLDGKIDWDSQINKGTTININIPL